MADVVTAVASAITSTVVSAISSWWGGKSDVATQPPQRQPQRVENTLSLSMRLVGAQMFECCLVYLCFVLLLIASIHEFVYVRV